jgi:hypothetical protein
MQDLKAEMLQERLEAFTAAELDKILLGNKPCQLWIKAQRFGDHLPPPSSGE